MKKNLILSITSISSVLATIPLTTISCGNTVSNSEEDIVNPILPPTEDNKPSQPGVDEIKPILPPVVEPESPSQPGEDNSNPILPPTEDNKPSQPGEDNSNPILPPTEDNKPSQPEESLPIRIYTKKVIQREDRFEIEIEGDNLVQDSSYYVFTNDKFGTKYMTLDETKTNHLRTVLYTEDFIFQNQDWKLEVKDHKSNLIDLGTLSFPDMIVVKNIENYVQYLYNGVTSYNRSLAKSMTSYQDYLEIYNWLQSYENSNVKINNDISIVTDRIEVDYKNLSNNSSTFEYSTYFSVYYKIKQNNNILKSFNFIYNNPGPINDPMTNKEYVTEDGIVIKNNKIIDYRGTSDTIVLKEKYEIIEDYGRVVTGTITEIADSAFENKGLRRVTLSETISKIGNKAFRGNNIVSISFPRSVKEIGESCFENNLLSALDLRNAQISHISDYAFANNTIMVLDWDLAVTSLGVGCFQNNLITKVDLSKTYVKEIPDFAFYHNVISELNWNSAVRGVGESAFERNQLTSVDFMRSNIRIVGKSAFKQNFISSLVMDNLEEIGDSAFENNSLRSVDFSKSYNLTIIGSACFKNNLITSITWNKKINQVSSEAFMNNRIKNDGLNLVNSNISCIEAFAFAYNDLSYNLWNKNPENIIHLPETIKLIGEGAFQSKEIFITKLDDGFVDIIDCNIFDVAGDANRFWTQVSAIKTSSSETVYLQASNFKDHWIQYSFNSHIIDINGVCGSL